MAYNKVYENKPIWHNDREPAINETRLNALSGAVDIIDDRVIELDEKPLNDMSNVDITNLQNGQGIKWNATTQKWENGIVGGSPIMTWAEYQEKWEAGEIEPLTVVTISDLSDAFVNLVALTWAEYQHLIEQELDDDNILYAITDRSAGLDLINDNEISEVQSWSSSKVNSKLADSGWVNIDGNYLYYRKVGNLVNLVGNYPAGTININGLSDNVLRTLPSELKPTKQILTAGATGYYASVACNVRIDPNGNLFCLCKDAETQLYFSVTYFV